MPIPAETAIKIITWKTPAVKAYACEFIKAGLNYLSIGIPCFGSDDVSECHQPRDHAVPGATISLLKTSGIIKDHYEIRNGVAYHARRTSRRTLPNGRMVNLYCLASRGIAEAFLERNGMPVKDEQFELELA